MRKLLLSILGVVFVLSTCAASAEPAPAAAPPVGLPAAGVNANGTRYDWNGNFKKAQAALAAKDYKTAIQLFTEILNSGRLPKAWLATTLYLRGKAYRSSHQYQQAVADYEAAIQADPKLDPAYYELGATYHSMGQYGKAIAAFSQAISLKRLSQRDELRRSQQSARRMIPAKQRLDAGDHARMGLHDRLIVECQLIELERSLEIALQAQLLERRHTDLRNVALHQVAPLRFGAVHRGVGSLQHVSLKVGQLFR